ncbi:MAG: nucleotidyltransferase domain-containing protein [Thiohalorhabdus sp.]|uniref:nucleotidyltransferase domain-containing protein n=1 Tax=Thiohalorhabdus sp. TaxID=3094134 RepID=UPI002FC36306
MRLSEEQANAIREVVSEEAGADARIRLFGSRVHDERRGGDVDLLVILDSDVSNAAWLAARLEARISRALEGRSVDVVLEAPSLRRSA